MNNFFGRAIAIYTREEALNDGTLVDVSKLAGEAGFKIPVAVTASLWSLINNIPEKYKYQDATGRLWDVLYMAALNSRRAAGSQLKYKIIMHHEVETDEGREVREEIILKAVIGPGDNFEPVFTIMLPNED